MEETIGIDVVIDGVDIKETEGRVLVIDEQKSEGSIACTNDPIQ